MVAQVDLLVDDMIDVPPKAMELKARQCSRRDLGQQIRIKGKHPWDEFPGGATAALKRVQIRPEHLVTTLNPKRTDPWALPEWVCDLCSCSYLVSIEQRAYRS